MLCVSMSGAAASITKSNIYENITPISNDDTTIEQAKKIQEAFHKMKITDDENYQKNINLPWLGLSGDILEWVIRLKYNGQNFDQVVPITILDFQEKFLKHPEYGEILFFDIDSDPDDDIEVIIGFYWSIIKDESGRDIKSIETRFRVRQLPKDDGVTPGIEDLYGELEVWSELRVNLGLLKEKSRDKSTSLDKTENQLSLVKNKRLVILLQLIERFLGKRGNTPISLLLTKIFSRSQKKSLEDEPDDNNDIYPTLSDDDYLAVGAGYRSPQGIEIPRYVEKRFAFAKDNIFSPTIFQNKMDPGNAVGKDPIDLIYGFQAYQAGSTTPAFDIEFSVEFEPAVYLITKFVPIGGYIYYFFDQRSQRYAETKVTFTSNILKGSGDDVALTLVFDRIDDSLAQSGSWMSFDVDALGDYRPLGGKFIYKASHEFDIGIIVSAPGFEEEVKVKGIPTSIVAEWDVDLTISTGNMFSVGVSAYAKLTMNSDLNEIIVYYPNSENEVLLDFVSIPATSEVGGAVTLNVDLNNMGNQNNYIYGNVYHTCSSPLEKAQVFLPDMEDPPIFVEGFAASASLSGELYWNQLMGFASGSSSGGTEITLNLRYGQYSIVDILELNGGNVRADFKISTGGYFGLDTTNDYINSNTLYVKNEVTGDELTLIVGRLSADNLRADWELDTSGEELKIERLRFGGILKTLKNLYIQLNYRGKEARLDLDWVLGDEGNFNIELHQDADTTLDFDLGKDSTTFDLRGSLTLSKDIQFDMSWQWKQGSSTNDPGHFTINEFSDEPNLKHFNLYFTYQGNYGVEIDFYDLKVYLDLEWWKGDRIRPYIWLDYEVSVSALDVHLLWNGEWHYNIEDWID